MQYLNAHPDRVKAAICMEPDGVKGAFNKEAGGTDVGGPNFMESSCDEQYRYEYYQIQALSKTIKCIASNVVFFKTTRLKEAKERIQLFRSHELSLHYQTLLDYYALCFQIAFDFCDAKQHLGLSDFKNYTEKNLSSFVNLSFLLCLISKILLKEHRAKLAIASLSVLNL